VRIASLHVYPVKGCRGIELSSATAGVTGLATEGAGDREWMVVDSDGKFLTQRELPRLALVTTAVAEGVLRLSAPHMKPHEISLAVAPGTSRDVQVWRDRVRGLDAGDGAARWMSEWLATDVRLFRFDRAHARPCNPEYAGDSGAHTLFADGYPILVIGEASLAELNERLEARGERSLPMNRFRPNLVLAGLPPFAEDHLDTIVAGEVTLRCVKPCVRCSVTTTDQATAHVGPEPLRTLGEFRMDPKAGGVTFGMNAIVESGAGTTLAAGASAAVDYRF